jgi:hypothetical protein
MRRHTRRLTALATCALILATACSSSGDDDSTTPTTDGAAAGSTTVQVDDTDAGTEGGTDEPGRPTAPETTAPRVDPESDAAMSRARSLNLTIDDFPSGWQNLPQSEAEVGVVELCTTVDLDAHLLALARSDAFSYTIEPGTLRASTSVVVLDEEPAAVSMIDDFRQDPFVQCATDTLRRDTDTYTITGGLARNETAPDLGDEAVALSGDFTITPTDGSPPHALSAIVVAARRADTVVIFSSTATDRGFDEETTRGLLTTIDERLER